MADDERKKLEKRVQELQAELAARGQDLATFRTELGRANGKLENLVKQIDQQLNLAAMIQKILVPTELPNIPGFEFSSKFIPSLLQGGDYFDIFEHEDRFRFGLVVASSSGYTISALFLSILLKMSGQLEARKGHTPAHILDLMARELIPQMQGADHAQLFYGVIDRRTYEMRYSCLGGILALHYNYAQSRLQRLNPHGTGIDPTFKGPVQDTVIGLQPRDRLILCSDGVIKASNKQGQVFGEERLFQSILQAPNTGVHETRNEIIYQLERFMAGADLPKDVTVIVTEVKDRVIKLAKPSEHN